MDNTVQYYCYSKNQRTYKASKPFNKQSRYITRLITKHIGRTITYTNRGNLTLAVVFRYIDTIVMLRTLAPQASVSSINPHHTTYTTTVTHYTYTHSLLSAITTYIHVLHTDIMPTSTY